MKKLVCLLLTIVLALSLIACAGTQQAATEDPSAQDSTADQTESKTVVEEIVLTTENWKNYFNAEMTVVSGELAEVYNGDDELTDAHIYRYYYLTLKDEYKNRITNLDKTMIRFAATCRYGEMDNAIALSTMDISWGERGDASGNISIDDTIFQLSSEAEIAITVMEEWEDIPEFSVTGEDLRDYGIFMGYEYAAVAEGRWGTLSDNFTRVQGSLFFTVES